MQSSTELAPSDAVTDEALLEKIEELSLIRELNDRLGQAATYNAACQMLVDMVRDSAARMRSSSSRSTATAGSRVSRRRRRTSPARRTPSTRTSPTDDRAPRRRQRAAARDDGSDAAVARGEDQRATPSLPAPAPTC